MVMHSLMTQAKFAGSSPARSTNRSSFWTGSRIGRGKPLNSSTESSVSSYTGRLIIKRLLSNQVAVKSIGGCSFNSSLAHVVLCWGDRKWAGHLKAGYTDITTKAPP